MSFIQIENLTFSYPDGLTPVFSNLNLRLDTSWKLGLIGNNGKGKSTFINLLCGNLKGEGRITANIPFRRFPCKICDETKTAYEIADEVAAYTEFWKIQREINVLGLPDEILFRPFNTLSGGERTKFLLAVLFASEGFTLLDEPTDHVDLEGREQIARYLLGKNGFIVVSHDRAFLDGCCDHILALTSGGAEVIRGNYSVWREEADRREENEYARKQSLEKERSRLERSAQSVRVWAEKAERGKYRSSKAADTCPIDRGFVGARAAKLQKRSAAAALRQERAESEISELLKNFEQREAIRLFPEPYFKSELFSLCDVGISFPEKTVFDKLNFKMEQGERVAVTGKNGTGKSLLLKLIAGKLNGYDGVKNLSPRLKISYVPQTFGYNGLLSDYAARYDIDESYFKAMLAKFGFESKDFTRDMSNFSEGQKKKAALARSLCERANLYIWDEPLNYLDILAREQLTEAILSSGASVLFVEHDSVFVDGVATRKFKIG